MGYRFGRVTRGELVAVHELGWQEASRLPVAVDPRRTTRRA